MVYKLAKELKDAGFPQGEVNSGVMEKLKNRDDLEHYIEFYAPTLSELIEEIYKSMKPGMVAGFKLEENMGFWWTEVFCGGKEYRAGGMFDGYTEFLKTPLIAVAKLWLKINTKNMAK